MYINRKSDNKSAIKRSNDRACVHRQAVADYRSHFKRMAGLDSEYEWMTKWISNKLLIRLIFLSSTSHFPLLDRLICIYTLHVVWKWIQISRITYVNVISPNRPCISMLLARMRYTALRLTDARCLPNWVFFLQFYRTAYTWFVHVSSRIMLCHNQDCIKYWRSRWDLAHSKRMDRDLMSLIPGEYAFWNFWGFRFVMEK